MLCGRGHVAQRTLAGHANLAHCVVQGMEFVDADTRGRLGIAAAQGGADAQVMLARMHRYGIRGPKDLAEAMRLYGLAAAQGHAEAQATLGSFHFNDDGRPGHLAEARRLYTLAAVQGHVDALVSLGTMHFNGQGGPQDFAEARRLYGVAAVQGNADAQATLGRMHRFGDGGPKDLAEARRLHGLAAAQGHMGASLDSLDRAAEADADAMMEQLLAEDLEEKKAKGAANSTKSAKSAKGKKPRRKRGETAAATSVSANRELKARDEGVEASVKGSVVNAQSVLETMRVAPLAAVEPIAAHPTAPEPVAPAPDAVGAATTPDERPALAGKIGARGSCGGRGGRALSGRGPRGRGGELDRSSPPPAAVMSLADSQFNTGRLETPESIGGQSTCIICFTNPKTHVAVPCGHQCSCGNCSAQMKECPVCRGHVQMWMHVHMS